MAEDSKTTKIVLRSVADFYGWKMEIVEDGAVAVERSQAGAFDLILMDVQMPRLDGKEATRRISRIEEAGRRVPIFALFANALQEEIDSCLVAGMDMAKPFRSADLVEAVA